MTFGFTDIGFLVEKKHSDENIAMQNYLALHSNVNPSLSFSIYLSSIYLSILSICLSISHSRYHIHPSSVIQLVHLSILH